MLTNSNFYIGDSSVSRLYQGENLIWDASHPDILLEYISNGDASTNPDVYFNTSMAPDLTLKVETKYSYHNRSTAGGAALFGSRASANDSRYYLFTYAGLVVDGQNVYSAKFWFKNQEGYSATVPTLDEPHVITTCATYSSSSAATAVNCILDGSVTSKAVSISSALSNTHQMYMFAINNQGTVDYKAYADTRIYYMKIWRDNNLVRFYIPVLHYINGQYTPCFYDKVNDTYIYNLGTDSPTYKISGDYLLDYIGALPETEIPTTATTNIRYDSGVYPSINLQTDIRSRSNYGTENYIFGSATDNTTNPKWQAYTLGCPGNLEQLRFSHAAHANGTATTTLTTIGTEITSVNTISAYYTSEGYIRCYLNGENKNNGTTPITIFPPNTIHLFSRHGNSQNINPARGSRIYFINFTTSNIPTKTYVPVLHNNQAAFLDLNSGTYISNMGSQTPYYQFKN